MKKFLFVLAAGICFYFSACTISGPKQASPGASFLVAQESATPALLDIFVNDVKFKSNVPYTYYSNYTLTGAGPYTFSCYGAGGDTILVNTTSVSFVPGLNYSIFFIDSINTMQGVSVQDDLNAPAGDSAKIRFMQFSPIGTADSIVDSTVDFAIHDSATILSVNRSFNDQNGNMALDSFINISAGVHNFEVRLDSLPNIVLTIPPDTLLPGKIYTLVLTGLTSLNGTPGGLRSYLVKHN